MAAPILDPPPDPGTQLTSYAWGLWFTKLYRYIISFAGTIRGATNGGSGVPVFDAADSTSTVLAFNSLVAGTNITLTPASGEIIISATGGSGGGVVDSVVGGTDISVDSTDPANPIVSFTGSTTGGILPVVNGEVPPVLVYNPDGSLVYTEIL